MLALQLDAYVKKCRNDNLRCLRRIAIADKVRTGDIDNKGNMRAICSAPQAVSLEKICCFLCSKTKGHEASERKKISHGATGRRREGNAEKEVLRK